MQVTRWITPAALVVIMSACAPPEPIRADFCDVVVARQQWQNRFVRIDDVAVLPHAHGWLLAHADCPNDIAIYDASEGVENTPEFESFQAEVSRSYFSLGMHVEADLEGRLRWGPQQQGPYLIVQRVYAHRAVEGDFDLGDDAGTQ